VIIAFLVVGVIIAAVSARLPPVEPPRRRRSTVWYRVLVAVLIAFGFVGGFSIGIPFLLVGGTLGLIGPYRHRPDVFWPSLIAVLSLILGYVLIRCHSTGTTTVCSNIIGIDYSGSGTYNPSLLPALIAGLGAALTAGVLTRVALVRLHNNQQKTYPTMPL